MNLKKMNTDAKTIQIIGIILVAIGITASTPVINSPNSFLQSIISLNITIGLLIYLYGNHYQNKLLKQNIQIDKNQHTDLVIIDPEKTKPKRNMRGITVLILGAILMTIHRDTPDQALRNFIITINLSGALIIIYDAIKFIKNKKQK